MFETHINMQPRNVLACFTYSRLWLPRGLLRDLLLLDLFKYTKLPHGNPANASPSTTNRSTPRVARQSPCLSAAWVKV